jgi:hypothetical protein
VIRIVGVPPGDYSRTANSWPWRVQFFTGEYVAGLACDIPSFGMASGVKVKELV